MKTIAMIRRCAEHQIDDVPTDRSLIRWFDKVVAEQMDLDHRNRLDIVVRTGNKIVRSFPLMSLKVL